MTDLLRDLDAYNPVLINANTLVIIGPCVISKVVISADGVAGDADIYDGLNDNMEKKYHLEALSGTTFGLPLARDELFSHGVYVKVNASTTSVMLSFKPVANQAIKAKD